MEIVEIYKECGDFYKTVKRSGVSPLNVHIALVKAGVLKAQDKIEYGTKYQKLGRQAEELFQKLVPAAIDANKFWRKNNPTYDFMYNNLTIDIKYSSFHESKSGNGYYWQIAIGGNQNVTIAFLERYFGEELYHPHIILIPKGFIDVKNTLTISKSSKWFIDFSVYSWELKGILDEYSTIFKDDIEDYKKSAQYNQ